MIRATTMTIFIPLDTTITGLIGETIITIQVIIGELVGIGAATGIMAINGGATNSPLANSRFI